MKTVDVVSWISLACALAACSGDKKLELGGSSVRYPMDGPAARSWACL